MRLIKRKSAQEIQDEIFRQMPPEKSFELAADLSTFLLELNKLGDPNDRRVSAAIKKNREDYRKLNSNALSMMD